MRKEKIIQVQAEQRRLLPLLKTHSQKKRREVMGALVETIEPYIRKYCGAYKSLLDADQMEDLWQEARIGAMRGIERFDQDLYPDTQLLTYVRGWIRPYVNAWLRDHKDVIRGAYYKDSQAVAAGRVDPATVNGAVTLWRVRRCAVVSLDAPLPHARLHHGNCGGASDGEDQVTRMDFLADADAGVEHTDALVLCREQKAVLAAAFHALLPREREVLLRRCVRGEHLEAIGASWGLTRERVRQVEAAAVHKLRRRFRAAGYDMPAHAQTGIAV